MGNMNLLLNVWFVFVAIMVLSISGLMGWVVFSLVKNPTLIGEFIGSAVNGYQTAVSP